MKFTDKKKPSKIVLCLFIIFLLTGAGTAVSQDRPSPDSTDIQRQAVRTIVERFGFRPSDGSGCAINNLGILTGIRGETLNSGLTSNDPVERVHQFFEQNQDLFQVQNPREELVVPNFRRYLSGAVTVYVDQMVSGVKVLSGGYIVDLKSDSLTTWITEIRSNDVGYIPQARNINTIPTIDSLEAGRIALADQNHGTGKTRASKFQLFIANFSDGPHLVWRFGSGGGARSGESFYYMIDAHNSAILDVRSASVN